MLQIISKQMSEIRRGKDMIIVKKDFINMCMLNHFGLRISDMSYAWRITFVRAEVFRQLRQIMKIILKNMKQ